MFYLVNKLNDWRKITLYLSRYEKPFFGKKTNTIKKIIDEYKFKTCHCIIHIINIDSNLVKKIKIVYKHMKKIFFLYIY